MLHVSNLNHNFVVTFVEIPAVLLYLNQPCVFDLKSWYLVGICVTSLSQQQTSFVLVSSFFKALLLVCFTFFARQQRKESIYRAVMTNGKFAYIAVFKTSHWFPSISPQGIKNNILFPLHENCWIFISQQNIVLNCLIEMLSVVTIRY